MSDIKAKSFRRMLICSVLVLAAARVYASSSPSQVELRCKIGPASKSRSLELQTWTVMMRGPTGRIVRVARAMDGQTVRFRDLDPGIYATCLIGSFNRIRCTSVDLNPPAGRKSFRVSRELETPLSVMNQDDLHTVNRAQLKMPQEVRDELDQAFLAQFHGDASEAIRHLKAALDMDPTCADAWNNLGTYYNEDGDYDKAVECFTRATQLNQDFYGSWANLSVSLISVARFREALDASLHAYRLRPHEPVVLADYAKSLYYLHQYDEARKYFEEAMQLDPESFSCPQLFLAQIAIIDGNIAEAKQLLARFFQLHPHLPIGTELRQFVVSLDPGEPGHIKIASSEVRSAFTGR